jgi:hypothetical protein
MLRMNLSWSGFLTVVNGKSALRSVEEGRLIWYTDGSRTINGTGAGVYSYGTRWELSFSPGQCTTVFQAQVWTIKACVAENLHRNYRIETSAFSQITKL